MPLQKQANICPVLKFVCVLIHIREKDMDIRDNFPILTKCLSALQSTLSKSRSRLELVSDSCSDSLIFWRFLAIIYSST